MTGRRGWGTSRVQRKVGVAVAALSALSLTVAGCSQTDEASDTEASRSCPAIADKPAKGNGEVVYWSMWEKAEPQQKVLQKTFDCFTEQTGIKVKVQWFGRSVLTKNVGPALNTDTVPDMIDQDISQVKAAVADPGGLQGVDDVMELKVGEGDKTAADVIDPRRYDFAENKLDDGSQMLVPYEMLSNAWWYQPSVIKDFQTPASTDDLFALFDAAKKQGIAAVAQDGDIDFYNAYFFTRWAEQYVGPGGILKAANDKSGNSFKSDPGFLKAAQLVERLAKGDYFIDGWDASKFPGIQQRWADGKAGYLYVGSWLPSEAGEYLKKANGGVDAEAEFVPFQMPMADGATHQTVEQMPIGFALTKKSANPEAAKALMAYQLNVDNLTPISTTALNLTPREDIAAPKGLEEIKAAMDDPKSKPVVFMDAVDGQLPDWTTNVFYPLDRDLLQGKITARQFIDRLAAGTQKYHS